MGGTSEPVKPISTMYVRLLEAVLADAPLPDATSRSHGPLAELVQARRTLDRHAANDETGDPLRPVADQLAYDAALIHLARRRGIWCHACDFGVPARGRARIEEALVGAGVNLSPAARGRRHHDR